MTFNASSKIAGRSVTIYIDNTVGSPSNRNLNFNSDFKFVGEKPAVLAANKVAILSMTCFGVNNSDVVCSYAVAD